MSSKFSFSDILEYGRLYRKAHPEKDSFTIRRQTSDGRRISYLYSPHSNERPFVVPFDEFVFLNCSSFQVIVFDDFVVIEIVYND